MGRGGGGGGCLLEMALLMEGIQYVKIVLHQPFQDFKIMKPF